MLQSGFQRGTRAKTWHSSGTILLHLPRLPCSTGMYKEPGLPLPFPQVPIRAPTGNVAQLRLSDSSRHWLRKQKQVSEKVFCSRSCVCLQVPVGGGRGSFGFDPNTSPLGGQAQLCFAAARLVTVQEQG